MRTLTKSTLLALASALMTVAIAAPMMAQAGTLTIYNEDCTYRKGFKKKKAVYVEVVPRHQEARDQCTDTKVRVKQGYPRTIALVERHKDKGKRSHPCYYRHKAEGVPWGASKADVRGDEHSRVGCKEDALGVCHCTKLKD